VKDHPKWKLSEEPLLTGQVLIKLRYTSKNRITHINWTAPEPKNFSVSTAVNNGQAATQEKHLSHSETPKPEHNFITTAIQ
jgi:hypothetical protein